MTSEFDAGPRRLQKRRARKSANDLDTGDQPKPENISESPRRHQRSRGQSRKGCCSRNTRERNEVDRYLKALHGLIGMLETPALEVILSGVDKRPEATLGAAAGVHGCVQSAIRPGDHAAAACPLSASFTPSSSPYATRWHRFVAGARQRASLKRPPSLISSRKWITGTSRRKPLHPRQAAVRRNEPKEITHVNCSSDFFPMADAIRGRHGSGPGARPAPLLSLTWGWGCSVASTRCPRRPTT